MPRRNSSDAKDPRWGVRAHPTERSITHAPKDCPWNELVFLTPKAVKELEAIREKKEASA